MSESAPFSELNHHRGKYLCCAQHVPGTVLSSSYLLTHLNFTTTLHQRARSNFRLTLCFFTGEETEALRYTSFALGPMVASGGGGMPAQGCRSPCALRQHSLPGAHVFLSGAAAWTPGLLPCPSLAGSALMGKKVTSSQTLDARDGGKNHRLATELL